MKAIILAAGIGSRLRPITTNKPKSMVRVAGQEILRHQVDAYIKIGVTDIAIVVGYQKEAIISEFSHEKSVNVKFISNDIYEDTNNMYSLWLARDFIKDEEFYLSNADVVFESDILKLYNKESSVVFVDKSVYNDESMKVSINENGLINHISKTVEEKDSYAASIDVYKFNKQDGQTILNHIDNIISNDKKLKDWTELALNEMFESGKVQPIPVDIEERNWVEIDNYEDLAEADKKFSGFDFSLSSYDNFVFDLDGTIFIGNEPIVSSINKVNELINLGKNVFFMTNNSSKDKSEYVKKLSKMNLDVNENQIISSVDNVIYFLKSNKIDQVYVLGTESLKKSISNAGIDTENDSPEYVVVGYDTELTYAKLTKACEFINKGVDYIATHIDMYCPTANGNIPDCGAITNMIADTTGKKVKYVFGKPNVEMFNSLNLDMSKTVIIGDRLYTDGKLAKNVNADYILVLSGETTRDIIDQDCNISISLCLKDFGCIDE